MKIAKVRILGHLFLIITFLALPYIFAPTGFPDLTELQRNAHERTNLATYLLMLAFFYLHYYGLLPKFYFNKRYVAYVLVVVSFFVALMLFIHMADNPRGMPKPFHGPPPRPMRFDKPSGALENSQTMFLFLVGLFVSFALRINDRLKTAEREKIHTELSYLKAQINPHFLFNTLNSIYSLAIEKSDRTADAVVMLSSLMRYVIRDASEQLVPLQKEIEYINHYVSLQKLRLDDTVQIDFQILGILSNKRIAPLILISFIENAFKYGVNPEQKSLIEILINLDQTQLTMHVTNSKLRISSGKDSSGGIGIGNTRTRLELLYPGKYALSIQDNPDHFIIDLQLDLS